MFKPKLPQQEQGFALVEVLVAILITTLFVATSMQAMAIAAVFKARAQEFTEATTWIQEDLENVKYSAASLQYTSLVDETIPDPTTGVDTGPLLHESTDTKLYVASVEGFKAGDKLNVGTDSSSNTISSIDTTNKTITLSAALGTTQPKGALVVATKRCNAASLEAGFADGLRDQVTGSDETGNTNEVFIKNVPEVTIDGISVRKSTRTNKLFTMTRTTTITNTAPFNVLQVSYTVSPTSGGSSVASFYTEVIPNAAFQCP